VLIARSLVYLGVLAHLSVGTQLGAFEGPPDQPDTEASEANQASQATGATQDQAEPPAEEAAESESAADGETSGEPPTDSAGPSVRVLDGGSSEAGVEPATDMQPALAPGPAPAPAPAVAPAAPPECRKHEDCEPDMACHTTRKMCLAPAIVASDTKRETVKLAVAAPIAIIMGGGLTGLGVWLLTLAKDKNRQADLAATDKEKDDLEGEANARTALGAAAVGLGSLAALGGLIGLAFIPVYVNRKRGAEKRMELSLFGSPMGTAGVRGRF
jgi:hypothetical protein